MNLNSILKKRGVVDATELESNIIVLSFIHITNKDRMKNETKKSESNFFE